MRFWEPVRPLVDEPVRPLVVTIVCVMAALSAATGIANLVSPDSPTPDTFWEPLLVSCSVAVSLPAIVGMWMMRRWSVYFYAAGAATIQLALLFLDAGALRTLIMHAALIGAMMLYLPRMR